MREGEGKAYRQDGEDSEVLSKVLPDEGSTKMSDEDPVDKWLRENRSGTRSEKPDKVRGDGASGLTDEARDISL